jgi:Tfp pilus assembly protein FimT
MAVVLIIGIVAAFVVPNLAGGSGREVREQARRIASTLELARQRSVMTQLPHRLVMDLDGGVYHLEWQPPVEQEEDRETPAGDAESADAEEEDSIDLSPPAQGLREFEPVPFQAGRVTALGEDVAFRSVEREGESVQSGTTEVAFDRDGASDSATIVLADVEGDSPVAIEIRPLADIVRVYDVR